MTRSMTVLQLLPALGHGGVERSTLEIAGALVKHGHRALVVSRGGALAPQLIASGASHFDHDVGRKSAWTLRHVRTLRMLITREQVDIVHARSRLPAWIGWLALRGMRERAPHLVTTVHGLNSPGRYSRILTRGERVICVSPSVSRHVRRHYPDVDPTRLRVIPRGVDVREFEPSGAAAATRATLVERWPALAAQHVITQPGRATRLKGHGDAIELLARLRALGADVALWMPGADDGKRRAYLEELEQIARDRGVAKFVAMTPPQQDRAALYAASDLVLQLSRRPEAFGRTVIEALASDRPVLGYAHGGVGDLLETHYPAGRVAVRDVEDLVVVAARLLENAPPRPAARTLPSLAAMQQATLDLYAELLDA